MSCSSADDELVMEVVVAGNCKLWSEKSDDGLKTPLRRNLSKYFKITQL